LFEGENGFPVVTNTLPLKNKLKIRFNHSRVKVMLFRQLSDPSQFKMSVFPPTFGNVN
jgi:hypothetical protein